MNMKCKLLAAAAAGALVMGGTCNADSMADIRPYVGAELGLNMPKYNSVNNTPTNTEINIKKTKPSLGILFGARICDYFGIEAGYNQALKVKDKNNGNISGKINNMYLDGLGYFSASPEVDLIGSVGFGRLKQKLNGATVADDKVFKAKTSYRIGVGVQYKFDDNVAARLMVRHQKGNKEFLKNMNSVALGVTYTF